MKKWAAHKLWIQFIFNRRQYIEDLRRFDCTRLSKVIGFRPNGKEVSKKKARNRPR